MAQLIAPTQAWRLLEDGAHVDGLWHLLPPRRSHRADELLETVCRKPLWPTTPRRWHAGPGPIYRREHIAVEQLRPEQLCRRCLGALQAQANTRTKKEPAPQPRLL